MSTSIPGKTYLVGGAVRDRLLGRTVVERDWVVVGSNAEAMTAAGFKPVGKDFPVFLHPQSHEEYALARTERKAGHGYHGFTVLAAPDVTLEQDLARRDLTINAIAESECGELIDPYGGLDDLDKRLLRHVSPAFAEDPVRILRVARFTARYDTLGFKVANETMALMRQMVDSGEVDHLVAERVWQETAKALSEDQPQRYFEVLRECGALARLFPEIDALFGIPQPAQYHPEIDCGIHTMMVLQQAARLTDKLEVRFAALTHDLGKGITPKDMLPSHRGHEVKGLPLVKQLCKRLKVPNHFRELALMVCEYHLLGYTVGELRPTTLVDKLSAMDAWRRPQRIPLFLMACEADARGRTGMENGDYPSIGLFQSLFEAALNVDAKAVVDEGYTGKAIGDELRKRRSKAIAKLKPSLLAAMQS